MAKEFYIGQIFNAGYPPEAAEFCNNRGDCYIEEIEPVESVRQFEIKEIPPPTDEELKRVEIAQIKSKLSALDLKSIRALRAGETEYLQEYESQAVALRKRLNELEGADNANIDT